MASTSKQDIWVGQQVKARIILDKILMRQMHIPSIPNVIWNIIIEYTCEDPRVVDAILKQEWHVKTQDVTMYFDSLHINHRWSESDVAHRTTLTFEGLDDPGRNIYYESYCCAEVLETVLMLPGLNNNHEIVPWEHLSEYPLTELRELLYSSLL